MIIMHDKDLELKDYNRELFDHKMKHKRMGLDFDNSSNDSSGLERELYEFRKVYCQQNNLPFIETANQNKKEGMSWKTFFLWLIVIGTSLYISFKLLLFFTLGFPIF